MTRFSAATRGVSISTVNDLAGDVADIAIDIGDHDDDQLFVAPQYQRQNLGRRLLAFTRQHLPNEIYLRCVRENEKAWRWYEREGFVFEKEEVEPMTGFVMKYYRWRQKGNTR